MAVFHFPSFPQPGYVLNVILTALGLCEHISGRGARLAEPGLVLGLDPEVVHGVLLEPRGRELGVPARVAGVEGNPLVGALWEVETETLYEHESCLISV